MLLASDRLLRALAVAQALAGLSAGATSALLVVLAARRLHVAGTGYGLLLSGIAVGALAGPLLLTRLGSRARGPRIVFAAFGLRGVVDVVLATVTALPAAAAALIGYGVGPPPATSPSPRSSSPTWPRRWVFAGFDLIWQAMRLISLLLGGMLADLLGIRAVFYAGGVLLLAAALTGVAAVGTWQRRSGTGRTPPPSHG